MARAVNGNKCKLIITLLVIGAGIVGTFAVLGRDVAEMKPDVKQNTEHRIKFEEKVNTMATSIETIRLAVEK